MAIITVNTAANDASDGLTSLQEAVALANGTKDADTIVFSKDVGSLSLKGAQITVGAKGGALTIRGDIDDDGNADIILSNVHIKVEAGADVRMEGLDFRFSSGVGDAAKAAGAGTNGTAGTNGKGFDNAVGPGTPITIAEMRDGEDGTRGTDGTSGGAGTAGGAGGSAGGAIVNEGNLTLVRVGFGENYAGGAPGAAGGRGGNGGAGGQGGSGERVDVVIPVEQIDRFPANADLDGVGADGGSGAVGANGGQGGDGGQGGNGGHAGGSILNGIGGKLTLTDVVFGGRLLSGVFAGLGKAEGGGGGNGGTGGDGGQGGATAATGPMTR